ncbi:MAG: EF-Tu/IF-2/RF-3 family GTPase, partial [candidate division WOR-3 bacterium]
IVAGCYVIEGEIKRNANVRVLREGQSIFDGKIASLKRFQEDVKEVQSGFECGIKIEGFDKLREGDIIECYLIEQVFEF